jgi:ABC-type multidrug transport system permease subunit
MLYQTTSEIEPIDKVGQDTLTVAPILPKSSKIISIIFALIGCLLLFSLIKYFNCGFEFSDEAFYLFMMQRPQEYTNFHILAGFIYPPCFSCV